MIRRNILFVIFLFNAAVFDGFGQAPAISWQGVYGGSGVDYMNQIIPTKDDGYVMCGWTMSSDNGINGSHGGGDFWVVKLDQNGNIQWQKVFGGSDLDEANAIIQTVDNGYAVIGSTRSSNGDVSGKLGSTDFWFIKLDASGALQWQKCLGGGGVDYGYDLVQTEDEGYVLLGETSSNGGQVSGNHGSVDYWIVKINSTGVLQWQKCLGGSEVEEGGYSLIRTSDGGFAVLGESHSGDGDVTKNHTNGEYWLVKLDANGAIVWQNTYGGSGYDGQNFNHLNMTVLQTRDGGLIVGGESAGPNDGQIGASYGKEDLWISKTDETGAFVWGIDLGGIEDEDFSMVHEVCDGGIIVVGNSFSKGVSGNKSVANPGTSGAIWIIKLNSAGLIQWQKTIGNSYNYYGGKSCLNPDGTMMVLITTGDGVGGHKTIPAIGSFDTWLVKLEAAGLSAIGMGVSDNISLCLGNNTSLSATGADNYMWSPAAGLSDSTNSVILVAPLITTTYTVMGSSGGGVCTDAKQVTVYVGDCISPVPDSLPDENIFIPKTFTPNDDLRNDAFFIYASGIQAVEIRIFDRWGVLVFETNDIQVGWDGKYKGMSVNEDIYVCSVRYLRNGSEWNRVLENVSVIR